MVLNAAAKIRNRDKAGGSRAAVVSFLAGLAVAAYGLAVFIKRDFLDYMLLSYDGHDNAAGGSGGDWYFFRGHPMQMSPVFCAF